MPNMAPEIDLNDEHAWDDSKLQDTWNAALNEYQKYHSIMKSGKRLEDVLTEEELKELREDYGDELEETESQPGPNGNTEDCDTDMLHSETNGVEHTAQEQVPKQEPITSEQQSSQAPPATNPAAHGSLSDSAMPQAILGSVQDENLKNLMMSWYFAGYYAGLYQCQQQATKDASSEP